MVNKEKTNQRPHWILYVCIAVGVLGANLISTAFLEPWWLWLDSMLGAGLVCSVGALLGCLVYYGIGWLLKE